MSELLVIGFKQQNRADEILPAISKLNRPEIMELEESTVITRDAKGDFQIKHKNKTIPLHQALQSFLGLLTCNLLVNAVSNKLGTPNPTLKNAIQHKQVPLEIREDFIREFNQFLQPNTSAIVLMGKKFDPAKLQQELKERDIHILHTQLPKGDVQKVRAAVEKELTGATR